MNDPRIIDIRSRLAVKRLRDWSDQNDCRIAAVLNERRPLPDYPVDPVELLRKRQIEREQEEFDRDLRIIGYGLAAAYLWVCVFRLAQIAGAL